MRVITRYAVLTLSTIALVASTLELVVVGLSQRADQFFAPRGFEIIDGIVQVVALIGIIWLASLHKPESLETEGKNGKSSAHDDPREALREEFWRREGAVTIAPTGASPYVDNSHSGTAAAGSPQTSDRSTPRDNGRESRD